MPIPGSNNRAHLETPHPLPVLTFDGDLLALKVVQVAQQHLLPVTAVADKAQVRQGALR